MRQSTDWPQACSRHAEGAANATPTARRAGESPTPTSSPRPPHICDALYWPPVPAKVTSWPWMWRPESSAPPPLRVNRTPSIPTIRAPWASYGSRSGACLFHLSAKAIARDEATAGPYEESCTQRDCEGDCVDRCSSSGSNHRRRRHHKETVALARRDRDDPTDLEELTTWTSRIIVFGGLAVGIIVIGLVVLGVWAFSGTPT